MTSTKFIPHYSKKKSLSCREAFRKQSSLLSWNYLNNSCSTTLLPKPIVCQLITKLHVSSQTEDSLTCLGGPTHH